MRKEVNWGNVVFPSGKIYRNTNYTCDNENEFWDMYDYLTNEGFEVTAYIKKLILSVSESVPVEEYRTEINGEEE
jgi:hypothetical protein